MTDVKKLRDALERKYSGSFELDIAASNIVILLIIHDSFDGLTYSQRIERVKPFIDDAGLTIGMVDLYTKSEASEMGLNISSATNTNPGNWDEAVSMMDSGLLPEVPLSMERRARRIVFYSYKGGVGRTTALVHTAFGLAREGQKVVVVDMDVEAPGIHLVLPNMDANKTDFGLIDYLWERQTKVVENNSNEYHLFYSESPFSVPIAYSVEDKESRSQIYVVPAGTICERYIQRLHNISSAGMLSTSDDAWAQFEEELSVQVDPDIILIDSRTGLGDWGGLSLLRLADEVFLVAFPSEQNLEGLTFVRKTIQYFNKTAIHTVISQVPEGQIGRALLERIKPALGLDEGDSPIEIYYNPSVASSETMPVESAMSSYLPLVNAITNSQAQFKIEKRIQDINPTQVISSLQFPERDAHSITSDDFEAFFQKTIDFERLIDDSRWVIRGRKGTGKSTLFHLFVDHYDNAVKRAKGRLESISILAGHGPAVKSFLRPTTDIFENIASQLGGRDWLSFWRAYAIVRMVTSDEGDLYIKCLKSPSYKEFRKHLLANFKATDKSWRSTHTTALMKMLEPEFLGLCRDALQDFNSFLEGEGRKVWLLYDDLDQDILENSAWQEASIAGLFRLAYDSNNQGLHNIRLKIFIREDLWSMLIYTNKSHFGADRTLLLEWKFVDFLRLAYRMACGGSQEYKNLSMREYPLSDTEIDSASEDDLQKALAPLWGMKKERGKNQKTAGWVYSRMTDAANNTYPRSLAILLKTARDHELTLRSGAQNATRNTSSADRLLSPASMQAGLVAASQERVEALKNEYPKIRPFIEAVEKGELKKSQFEEKDLREAWSKTVSDQLPDFVDFINLLKMCGLLIEKKKSNIGNSYDFAVASLYIDGLKLSRVQGEKK